MNGAPKERGLTRAALSHTDAQSVSDKVVSASQHNSWAPILFGCAVFLALWLLDLPYRHVYQPTDNDVTALADGLLLVPGAGWQDWFVHGHSHFFDAYPEWPLGLTAFARPVFQFTIYLAHFLFGKDWPSYLAINYLGVTGIALVAFAIARTALGLSARAALLAAALVLCSPAVLEFSIWQIGFGSESLACILIGCAFLACLRRRDLLCGAFLVVALFTKETVIWAPVAAAMTVLLRALPSRTAWRRSGAAAMMLLPLAVWFAFRLAFYGGIGGTYASPEYTPLPQFVDIARDKLFHLHHLFVQQAPLIDAGNWALGDQAVRILSALLALLLLVVWIAALLRRSSAILAPAMRQRQLILEPSLLASLWAILGLVFFFALPIPSTRYAAAAVMFAWPAIVQAVISHRQTALRIALAASFISSLGRTAYFLAEMNPPGKQSEIGQFLHDAKAMDTALQGLPPDVRQVYVLMAGGLVTANPSYLGAFLGVNAQIVRVIDLRWQCSDSAERPDIRHDINDEVVTISMAVPDCARFEFLSSVVREDAVTDGVLHRSATITYELPEARPIYHTNALPTMLEAGRRATVRIHTHGPARFIIEEHGTDTQLTWFDIP